MQIKKAILLFTAFGILNNPDVLSQSQTYTATDGSYVEVRGTSTLHDWSMRSEVLTSEVEFATGNGEPESIESVVFIVQKVTLESDNARLHRMAHEEMDADNYPEISFESAGTDISWINDHTFRATAEGDLTVSGVTRRINVEATCANEGELLICTGAKDLRMTDFDIDPPRLFLGTLRTHDEITVEFRMMYAR